MTVSTRRTIIQTVLLLCYLFGAFMTYGALVAREERTTAAASARAAVWPLYWPCRGVAAAVVALADASVDCWR